MGEPLCVLIVEDNALDAELVARELRRAGFEPEWKRVDSEERYLEELGLHLDVILSDYQMPQFNGLRALELLKERGWEIPFIIISGTIGEETAVEAMKRGAADYLLKDRMARLGPALRQALSQARIAQDRKSALAALELRERALAQVSQGVLIADEKRVIVYANPSFTEITGYEENEIVGRSCAILQGPGTDPGTVDALRRALRDERPFEGEILNYRKDGTPFWNELTLAPIRDVAGGPIRFIGIQKDVTGRKRDREALRASEEAMREERALLRALIDSIPDIIFFKNQDSVFLGCNKAFERFLGIREADLIGKTDYEIVSRDVADRYRAKDRELLASGTPLRIEEWIPYPGGGAGFFETLKTPFYGPTGDSLGVVGVSRDISERKQIEEERRRSMERLKLAVAAGRVGIWELDIASDRLEWDAQMREIYGLGANDAVAFESAFGWIHPDDCERVRREFAEIRSSGLTSLDSEFRIVRKDDGRERFIQAAATVMTGPSGEPTRMVGVNRDVTEERLREKSLAEALAQEKELAEKARAGDRAKSEFLAVMSHEVRTPINGILGFASLLAQAGSLADEHRNYAQVIVQSSESLLRILDDILDFSRMGAGRLQLLEASFSPRELLRDIQNLLAPQASEKGLRLEVRVAESVPAFLEGDSGRIRQILLNIVGNALKFTHRGSVAVTLRSVPDQPSTFVFAVKDTGVGIPPEQLEQIFLPFTQADSSVSRRHGGTGLGLSIARRLAELMGGELSVRSCEGEGTEFFFSVALRRTDRPPADLQAGAQEPLDAGFAQRHPLRILVAEDDRINLQLVQTLLRRLGYESLTAKNGREALEVFRRERPDCVLMDVQMPEMDGIEATVQIRSSEKCSGSPPSFISALTANIFPADRQRCIEAGMDDYLNKPVKLSGLAHVLARAAETRAPRTG